MFYEYAVDPAAVTESWQNFRYLLENFGFDKGRLISDFPKDWHKQLERAINDKSTIEKKKWQEKIIKAEEFKIVDLNRSGFSEKKSWLTNAINEHKRNKFRAIIALNNPEKQNFVLNPEDLTEENELFKIEKNKQIPLSGKSLSTAMSLLLKSAKKFLFVDPYFDIENAQYMETLNACVDEMTVQRKTTVFCEIHFNDHDKRPSMEHLSDIIIRNKIFEHYSSKKIAIKIFSWKKKVNLNRTTPHLHPRYLLTNIGGIHIDSGFEAHGEHLSTDMALVDLDHCHSKMDFYSENSDVFELNCPIIEVEPDGSVNTIFL